MIDIFLDVMLGPFRVISQFYFKNQLFLNTILIGLAAYNLFFNRSGNIQSDSKS